MKMMIEVDDDFRDTGVKIKNQKAVSENIEIFTETSLSAHRLRIAEDE